MTLSARSLDRRAVLGLGLGAAAAVVAVPRSARATPDAGATTVYASSFGFDPADATNALQAALDSTADVVVVDDVGADWFTRPLFLRRSNVTIVISEGVTVRALVGGYPKLGDSLLTVDDQENVTIIGYRAQVIMNKPEYTAGEWRMCFSLRSVRNVLVEGITLAGSGGDGIYLGVSAINARAPRFNSDITLRNVVLDNHRRNCLSVISADGLLIEGCAFTNADGTAPRAGVDFEPNKANERLSNIVLRDSVISGNASTQLVFAMMKLDSTSAPVSILVERVLLGDQFYGNPQLMVNDGLTTPIRGEIEIRDVLIRTVATPHADKPGSLGFFRKASDSVHVTFRRCVMWNWGNDFFYFRPITIMNTRSTGKEPLVNYGGVTFDGCVLVTDQAPPLFNAIGTAGSHLTNVHGDITVIGPSTAESQFGPDPVDVDLTLTAVPAVARQGVLGASVDVAFVHPSVAAGDTIELEFTRRGGLLSSPMAVEYRLSGTCEERHSYAGSALVAVFPPGEDRVRVRIATRTGTRRIPGSIVVELVERPFYTIATPGGRRGLIRPR